MKLVTYSVAGDSPRAGLQLGDEVVATRRVGELAGWTGAALEGLDGNRTILEVAGDRLAELEAAAYEQAARLREEGALRSLSGVRLGPPIVDPQKIICLGLNYRDHAEEAGLQAPAAPMFFAKFANSLAGPADAIVPPAITRAVDYEAEVAVVIGRTARNVDAGEALGHVAGAMAFNDVSARDLQLANPLWTGGKAIDTFAPCGPALVTLDELGDVQDLAVRTRVNGRTVQDGSTRSMIFGVAETIAFLSRVMTLVPGDVIATGTPAGVGNARTPKLFLRPGDVVEVEVGGVGVLENPVAHAA